MKKGTKIALGTLVGFIVMVLVIAAGLFYMVEVRGDKSFVLSGNSSGEVVKKDPLADQKQAWKKVDNKQDVALTTKDGTHLKGQYIPAAKKTNKTAVMIHGFGVDHTEMIPYANLMHDQGYNVLLSDNRAAGKSEGSFIGYGYLEAKDYLEWIDKLIDDNPNSEIVVYGTSLGGATTMLLSGMNPPKQVKAFIEDCGYTSMREELVYEANTLFGIPKWVANPLISVMSVYSKILAGYSYNQVDSVAAVKKNDRPMLFIHGDEDNFVPGYMVHDVYDAAKGPKEKMVVAGADHMEAYRLDIPKYEHKVESFLDKYMD